jgi:RND family efflux transporter MFP subunit
MKAKIIKHKLAFSLLFVGLIILLGSIFYFSNNRTTTIINTVEKESVVRKSTISVGFTNDGKIKSELINLNFKNNLIVSAVLVKQGDQVVQGQELAKLDDRTLQQQINQANYNYYKAIYERNKIDKYSQPDSYGSAQQQVNITYTQLQLAKLALEDATLKSPVAGIVNEVNIVTGASSQPGTNLSAMQIIPKDSLYVENYLEEYEVQQIALGTLSKVTFGSDSLNTSFNGQVSFISAVASYDNTGFASYLVKTKFSDGDLSKIREGYSIENNFIIKEVKDVLIIPNSAVNKDAAMVYVFRKTSSGEKEKVEIKTGFTNNVNVEVVSGLNVGDIVYSVENAK